MKEKVKKIEHLEIETSFLYDVISEGELFPIEYANLQPDNDDKVIGKETSLILYTKEIPLADMPAGSYYAGFVIDSELVVCQTFQKQEGESRNLAITNQGAGILVTGASKEKVMDIAGRFQSGDMIKLRFHGISIPVEEAVELAEQEDTTPILMLDYLDPFTTMDSELAIRGQVLHLDEHQKAVIRIRLYNGKNEQVREANDITIGQSNADGIGEFAGKMELLSGANYIDVAVVDEKGDTVCCKSMIVFRKEKKQTTKQAIMWVEQYVTANQLNTPDKMRKLIGVAKVAGVTAFAVDVKGCEGFASYKKATLSHAPYITESINPKKQITMEIDFLEEFVKVAHEAGCKVYASLNFFVEGNIRSKDFAIHLPETHPDWAEVLQAPEDGGELKSVLETKRDCMLCYVNPANDEVVEYELLRAREVIENYDVDGIVLDRTRYDNQFADFSEQTREKFETFLKARGKELNAWPMDVYHFGKDQEMVFGPLYLEWITFRSMIIKKFASKLRGMIEDYNQTNGRHVGMAAYVGSWYELYYQNGVNWASEDFCYNDRLKFPMKELYTEEYAKVSYLDQIDFLMIGCYYATKEQIEKYLTIGNILTNHKIPLIGSISLPHLTTKELQRTGYRACYEASEGCMIFDLCYVDWEKMSYAMKLE